MTKFITYYNLCPIPEVKEFLGIAADRDEENIITTLGRNIIIVIKISTQKQVRSWSVVEKLSSKVVYDRSSQKYVGVFANRALRCWDENTADVNKCKKLKFQKSIAELVTNGENTLVLYSDGTCEPLMSAIQSRKKEVDSGSSQQLELTSIHTFSNAQVHTLPGGNQILTYFERNNNTGEQYMIRLALGSPSSPQRFNLKRENLDAHVAGAAVIEGETAPMLFTIWSDKRIFLLNLTDDVSPERSPGNFVSMLMQLKVDCPLSVLGISSHFVAIYGANHGQEGASLLLYNTQYKVIKTKQFFKVYFNFSQLWAINEHILLAMGQNLSVVKYRVLKEVLSELVGTQVSNDYQTPVEGDHINEEDLMQECLQYTGEVATFGAKSKFMKPNNLQCVPVQADGKEIPYINTDGFNREMNALNQLNMHVEVVQVSQPMEDVQINLMSNYYDCGFSCPEIQLIARQLERSGASEHEISEKLMTVLIRANLLEDIAVCLRRYTNISEKVLAKTLGYVLHHFDPDKDSPTQLQLNSDNRDQANGDVPFNMEDASIETEFPNLDLLVEKYDRTHSKTEVVDVLNAILACSFDPEAIATHIRQYVDYSQVLSLLKHLYRLLTDPDVQFFEERPSLVQCCVEFELQILRWFGIFLNTHFQKLALSKDVELIELLFKWHELFLSYKREMVELQQISALLYSIVDCKKTIKEKNYSKWYSIEEVYLF